MSFGIPTVASLRKHTKAFLDWSAEAPRKLVRAKSDIIVLVDALCSRLMVSRPEQWVSNFAKIGVDQYTFHIEATSERLFAFCLSSF